MRLRDKIVLITGGTTGIGAATARLFHSEGAKVIVTGSSAKTVEAAKPDLPGVEVVVADQADTQASKALVDRVENRYGAIDVLFVNAGVGKFATLDRADEAHFNSIFSINVRGLYFMTKYAAPVIPNGGAIIFTGSTAGLKGGAGMSVYSATKAAVRSLARTLAAELAPRNVRVNVISPGVIENSDPGQGRFDPRATQRLARKLEATHSARSHRPARGGGRDGVVPCHRRHIHHGSGTSRGWGRR